MYSTLQPSTIVFLFTCQTVQFNVFVNKVNNNINNVILIKNYFENKFHSEIDSTF